MNQEAIKSCISQSKSRFEFWVNFLKLKKVENLAELGVYRGDFAAYILRNNDQIKKYYMIDPWRHLDNWNKPANVEDDVFEKFLAETKSKTDFASNKRR